MHTYIYIHALGCRGEHINLTVASLRKGMWRTGGYRGSTILQRFKIFQVHFHFFLM